MPQDKYNLKFTTKANEDLKEIYNYISTEFFAKDTAYNISKRIEQSIMRLKDFPFFMQFCRR